MVVGVERISIEFREMSVSLDLKRLGQLLGVRLPASVRSREKHGCYAIILPTPLNGQRKSNTQKKTLIAAAIRVTPSRMAIGSFCIAAGVAFLLFIQARKRVDFCLCFCFVPAFFWVVRWGCVLDISGNPLFPRCYQRKPVFFQRKPVFSIFS